MDKTKADKLMYLPSNNKQIYPHFRLKLVIKTFEHSTNQLKFTKATKVVKPTNKKTLLKIFGD